MSAANPPEVPIDVDPETGVWTTDGLPMLYLPRHFFINNHLAIEQALGRAAYAKLLYTAGHRSAYYWCEQAAARHRLAGIGVFHHYLSRLSQRGWGRFDGGGIDPQTGTGEVRVTHSCFVAHAGRSAAQKVCYMLAGTELLCAGGHLIFTFACGTSEPGLAKMIQDVDRTVGDGGHPSTGCFHWISLELMAAAASFLGYAVDLCEVDPEHGRDGHFVARLLDPAKAARARELRGK